MSYVLIDGTRYYKDDRTGRVTKDNVSEEAAEQRAKRNQSSPVYPKGNNNIVAYNHITQVNRNSNNVNITNTGLHATSFPWGTVIILTIVIAFIGAFFYNRSHVSDAEQQISEYMERESENKNDNEYTERESENKNDNEYTENGVIADYSETYQEDYLLPFSSERYLRTDEISDCSHDEIQLMINEIYARHGREFDSQDSRDYFSSKEWYDPVYGKTDEEIVSEFNEYEKANITLLKEYL
ncbi:MAG: YARHG domain-containing protein [Lachnospiraceae bacterium]|nr:YARHG domain-containing protein [Lachnospiraceae bacterium]